jgi:hypothetical protein
MMRRHEMAKRPPKETLVEQAVADAKALRDAAGLSGALEHPSARVVIAAAHCIEANEVRGCDAALLTAFKRLDSAEVDPQCRGKIAVLRALMALEADTERVAYLLGRTCVRPEKAWGPPVDTAAEAFELLRDYQGRASDVAFVALALLRHEPATVHLLEVIAGGSARHAEQAVKALAHFKHDPVLCERVRAAAKKRGAKPFEALVETKLQT